MALESLRQGEVQLGHKWIAQACTVLAGAIVIAALMLSDAVRDSGRFSYVSHRGVLLRTDTQKSFALECRRNEIAWDCSGPL